jgi:hypothetical protein
MKKLAFLLLALAFTLPLRAQTAPSSPTDITDDTTPQNSTGMTGAPYHLRMPQPLDHKPDATPPPAAISGPIEHFFATLKSGDYAGAYETFLAGTRLGAQKQKMSYQISKTEEAFGLYGKLNDIELYDDYPMGKNIVVLTYFSRHENQPLRWRFIYYRADTSWMLINIGFDDPLLDLIY